jgi:DNA invertase Pin-like site-specific DNA recombinase
MTKNGKSPQKQSGVFLGYVRKSIIMDPRTASPARQRAAIERRLAYTHPGVTIEWFEDLDKSGRNEASRPDWQRLLRRVQDPDVIGVAVESLDRNHRNLKQFLNFYDDILAPAGKTLVVALQNIDMSSTDGRALASILMALAEAEASKASDRMTGTLAHIRTQGRFHGGNPFGCDRDPLTKHLIPTLRAYLYSPATGEARPDEDPAPPGFERRYYHDALHELFTAYATGTYSLFDVALYLNASGWRFWDRKRANPVPFKESNTQSIISNWEIYAGRIPATSGQRASGVQRPVSIQGAYPPILPVELCERAGAILRARIGTGGPRQSGFFLAGGLVYCATCGVKLIGHSIKRYTKKGGEPWRYYRHHAKAGCPELRARADDIHREIMEAVEELLGSGLLEALAAELRRLEIAPASPDAAKAQEKEAEMERLVSLHIKGLITEAEFAKFRAAIQVEIDRLKPGIDRQTISDIEEIIDHLGNLRGKIEADEPLLQKEILRTLFERIEISDRRVTRLALQPWLAGLMQLDVWTKVQASISALLSLA